MPLYQRLLGIYRRVAVSIGLKKESVSSDYKIIPSPDRKKLQAKFKNAWKEEIIPIRQQKLTDRHSGNFLAVPAIRKLAEFVSSSSKPGTKVLEVGCSTGYHQEAFTKAGLKVKYYGCDYSPSFIKAAREKYPKVDFKVSDATNLGYKNEEFETVISGCCILHIIGYEKAISEAARVAKKYVIFHRTPVVQLKETTFAEKIGYGIKMVEIFFNESELVRLFSENGLVIEAVASTSMMHMASLGEPVFMKTYLCRKI